MPYDALDDEHVKKMFDILRMRLGVLVLDDEVIKWAANEEYDDSLNGFVHIGGVNEIHEMIWVENGGLEVFNIMSKN